MLFRGNEPSHLLQTQELAFLSAQNELVFECKRTQIEPKKGPKNHPLCGIEVKIRDSPSSGRAQGGLHEVRIGRLQHQESATLKMSCRSERSEESRIVSGPERDSSLRSE